MNNSIEPLQTKIKIEDHLRDVAKGNEHQTCNVIWPNQSETNEIIEDPQTNVIWPNQLETNEFTKDIQIDLNKPNVVWPNVNEFAENSWKNSGRIREYHNFNETMPVWTNPPIISGTNQSFAKTQKIKNKNHKRPKLSQRALRRLKRHKQMHQSQSDGGGGSFSKESQSIPGEKTDAVFEMAFTHQNIARRFTSEEANSLKSWILQKIDEETGEVYPNFMKCKYSMNALHVTCSDQSTKDWLTELVQKQAPWMGAELLFVEAERLSKAVSATVWVPGPPVDSDVLLTRLEKQNKDLCTKNWKVVEKILHKKGQNLTIVMDEASWNNLEKFGYRPFVNFTKVTFKPFEFQNGEEETREEQHENQENVIN